jgi:hypothetical protein
VPSPLQVVSKSQCSDDTVDSTLQARIFGFGPRNHRSAPPVHLVGLHANHQAADIEFLRYHLGQFGQFWVPWLARRILI